MTMTKAVLTLILTLFLANLALAEDLVYPSSVQEIVSALALKDGKATIDGREYVSHQGKVYEIVNGLRVRHKCNQGDVVDTYLAPKTAALITFNAKSATIHPKSFGLLDNYASALQGELADAKIKIVGHVDETGNVALSTRPSELRAAAVKRYLVQQGVAAERLEIAGFGPNKPVVDNATESGRAKNRRIEFIRPLE